MVYSAFFELFPPENICLEMMLMRAMIVNQNSKIAEPKTKLGAESIERIKEMDVVPDTLHTCATCHSQGSPDLKHTLLCGLFSFKWNHNLQIHAVLKKTWNVWDHKLIWKVFTEVINQGRSRVILPLFVVETDFLLQPLESPPASYYNECRFKALLHWLYFSDPEVSAWLKDAKPLCKAVGK